MLFIQCTRKVIKTVFYKWSPLNMHTRIAEHFQHTQMTDGNNIFADELATSGKCHDQSKLHVNNEQNIAGNSFSSSVYSQINFFLGSFNFTPFSIFFSHISAISLLHPLLVLCECILLYKEVGCLHRRISLLSITATLAHCDIFADTDNHDS